MDALQRIQAFGAARSADRELVCEHGLPVRMREGRALCVYSWTCGELTSLVEPDGTRFDYRYGEDGRLLAVDRAGLAWARFDYDSLGRLAAVHRPDGPLAHQYDTQGRLVCTRRGDAGPFEYRWQDGRVSEARSDHEQTRFDHDARGRLLGLAQQVDGITLSLRFDFDSQGRLRQIRFPEWQQRIGFAWDERGRPSEVSWNGTVASRLGTDDNVRLSWSEAADGVRCETWHEAATGRPLRQRLSRAGGPFWEASLERDEAFRLVREGERAYAYDGLDRLVQAREGGQAWSYRHDPCDNVSTDDACQRVLCDAEGRVRLVQGPQGERVFRHNQAGDMLSLVENGVCAARCSYDHKGRLVRKQGRSGTERYLYAADDSLLAVADEKGRPLCIVLRLPTGLVGLVDFRREAQGELLCLHCDAQGNLLFVGSSGALEGPLSNDPYGLPMQAEGRVPAVFRGRFWHADLGLYRIGCRWYDPRLRRFLTPDTHTGGPDDARLLNPFVRAIEQRMLRASVLGDWLRQPRLRNRHAYCANDPVNRFDPDGHWSFGATLLSLLGALWTLPNTAFGLAIEISCLVGEAVRWLASSLSQGQVNWHRPGFDLATSGRLNAFALVFKGGWLGSFERLLGITFGNVMFINPDYPADAEFQQLPDPVAPAAYGGGEVFPKAQALYEHELRHVKQYALWGPFFHLGLPHFGVYEWDVILNGFENAGFEKDARAHGGF